MKMQNISFLKVKKGKIFKVARSAICNYIGKDENLFDFYKLAIRNQKKFNYSCNILT
jgi:hypothetical protein